jgi:uroporphyrinogen-III synthase
MAASLVAGIAAYTRRKLKRAGCISEDTAKTARELGLREKWLELPDVKKTPDGRYYLARLREV